MAKANQEKKAYTRKKVQKVVPKGRAYIRATYNNTIVTVTDELGNVLSWASSGACGFKGARKSTPYAGQVAAKEAVDKAKIYGMTEVDVHVKGVGSGREQAIRSVQSAGLQVNAIIDETPIPHGGCRPKKPRRV